jgi:hypothetical protein
VLVRVSDWERPLPLGVLAVQAVCERERKLLGFVPWQSEDAAERRGMHCDFIGAVIQGRMFLFNKHSPGAVAFRRLADNYADLMREP